jgi:predicted DCC family thiol-disulfide oxidoreductase YuxK
MIATAMARDSTSPPNPRWIILYDADCGFCRTALAAILSADRDRRLRPLALGTAEADGLLADLTPAQRDASWHLVSPDGHRESAGAAGPALLRLLPGGALPAAALTQAPDLTERAYEWVADHRSALSRMLPSSVKQRATRLIRRRTS